MLTGKHNGTLPLGLSPYGCALRIQIRYPAELRVRFQKSVVFNLTPFRAAEHRSKGRIKGVGCLSAASSRALRPLREAQGRP